MTFNELNRKMQSLFNGERFTEEDFAKFLTEKGVVCAADLIRQIWYQNGNDEIFGTQWEKFPAYLKAFEISGIGKKFGVFNISASFSVGILCIAYLLDSLITRGRFDFDWYFILAALAIAMNEFYINQYTVPKIRKIIHNFSGIF